MSIKEENNKFNQEMLEEVETFHQYFMSYDFEEQLKDVLVALRFRSAVDMLCRSYIHFINSTLQEDGAMEAVKLVDAKSHLRHMQSKVEGLKRLVEYNKKTESKDS
jgi:hypothetical protein